MTCRSELDELCDWFIDFFLPLAMLRENQHIDHCGTHICPQNSASRSHLLAQLRHPKTSWLRRLPGLAQEKIGDDGIVI